MSKFSFSVAFTVAFLGFVAGYNFEDSEFNLILAQDLFDFHDDHQILHRTRREEPQKQGCRKRQFRPGCCGEETFQAVHEKDLEMKKECHRQYNGKDRDAKYFPRDPFKCDNVDMYRKEVTCVSECMMRKKGLLEADGRIKEQTFKDHIKEVLSKEAWLLPSIDKIADKCFEEVRNSSVSHVAAVAAVPRPSVDPIIIPTIASVIAPTPVSVAAGRSGESQPSCNPSGIILARCMYKEIQLSCPAELIKDEKACAKLKDRIKKNEEYFPFKEHLQMDDDN